MTVAFFHEVPLHDDERAPGEGNDIEEGPRASGKSPPVIHLTKVRK